MDVAFTLHLIMFLNETFFFSMSNHIKKWLCKFRLPFQIFWATVTVAKWGWLYSQRLKFVNNMPFVMSGMRTIRWKSWGRNKTSRLHDEASRFSSGELMITCRSSGLLHLHTNWLLGPASSWQAPVFSALSSPCSTKESLEVFYLCLGVQFLVCQERNSTN